MRWIALLSLFSVNTFAFSKFSCLNDSYGMLEGKITNRKKMLTLTTDDSVIFAKNLDCTFASKKLPLMRCRTGDLRFYSSIYTEIGFPNGGNYEEVEILKFNFNYYGPGPGGATIEHKREFKYSLNQCVVE